MAAISALNGNSVARLGRYGGVTVTCFWPRLPCPNLDWQLEAPAFKGCSEFGTETLTSAVTHVAMVRKLFPDWDEEILRLSLCNETFRDMCEEYGLAVEALAVLEYRNRPDDVERMQEYRTLIKQLEKDLKYELLAACDPDRLRQS